MELLRLFLLLVCVFVVLPNKGMTMPTEPRLATTRDENEHSKFDMDAVMKRIVNGEEAQYGEHPYICSIKVLNPQWTHHCGAVIFNTFTLLTAAHCLYGPGNCRLKNHEIGIMCGEHFLDDKDEFEQVRDVKDTFTHSDFDPKDLSHDIAIIALRTPLVYDKHVQALPIDDGTRRYGSRKCVLAGWGHTGLISPNILHDLEISVIDNEQCSKLHKGKPILPGQLCFKDVAKPTGSCHGDSGGPAVCDGMIVGLTSWGGIPCVSMTKPSVFTRLSYYHHWIFKHAYYHINSEYVSFRALNYTATNTSSFPSPAASTFASANASAANSTPAANSA